MSWQEDVHLVPSHNRELLASLVGRPITRLVHHAELPASELLADHAYAARHVKARQLFSFADGPAVVTVGNQPLCVAQSAELMSVTIEPAALAEIDADWPVAIDAADTEYSEPRFARAIGRSITAIRVLQRDITPTMSPSAQERPREAALVFALDDGSELVFGLSVVDAPNDFAVLTKDDVPATWAAKEITRVP